MTQTRLRGDGQALGARIREHWQLYVFLSVPLLYIIVFAYIPMGGLAIAFEKYNGSDGFFGSAWVGFRNFETFFRSYEFERVLRNTLTLSFYSLLANFPLPILFALALNAVPGTGYRRLVQTVAYMPHFISTVVIVGLLMQVLNARIGAYGVIFNALTGSKAPDLFAEAGSFPHMYVWSGVWQGTGWSSIIYFAALSGIDTGLHEAAQIDGANRFQRMIHIDLPCILPTASIMLIMAAGRVMSVGFEKVYLMQNTINLKTSEVISTYVYKMGMVNGGGDFSFGTAVGMFNSVVNFILIIAVNRICRSLGGSSLW